MTRGEDLEVRGQESEFGIAFRLRLPLRNASTRQEDYDAAGRLRRDEEGIPLEILKD